MTAELREPGEPTAGGGAPDGATYLVGAAHAGLPAEIVVGATPGGELGGTWAAPTVDAAHSGSTHAATQAAAESTAATALSGHVAAADPHPVYLTAVEGNAAYDATGAAAAAHASAVQRANHTGTQAESTVTDLVTDLAAKAPLASPTFTGTPAAPTASQGTNTAQVSTTAYVQTEAGLLIPKSLVDAAGDLLVGTADNTVARMPVGSTAGQALVADPQAAEKLVYAYAAADWNYRNPTGALAATFDRQLGTGQAIALQTTSQLYLVSIILAKGMTITSVSFMSGAAANTPTNQWFGIFTAARAIARLTVNDTTTAWAANTVKTLALSSQYVVPSSGRYYLGVCTTATTPPTYSANAINTTNVTGLAPALCGQSSSGLTTPASCPDPVAAPAGGHIAYAWVS